MQIRSGRSKQRPLGQEKNHAPKSAAYAVRIAAGSVTVAGNSMAMLAP
jgi:hypothetical protein